MPAERSGGAHGVTLGRGIESFVAEHYDRLMGLARLVCGGSDSADAVQVGLERVAPARNLA